MAWDAIPLFFMLIIHYKNFSSFENEEILFTEYTAEAHDSGKGYTLENTNDAAFNNERETSGVINLESQKDDLSDDNISLRSGSNAENLNRPRQNHTK